MLTEKELVLLEDLVGCLDRIAEDLDILVSVVTKDGVVRTKDVERAKVYTKHLGKKLRRGKKT